LITGTSSGIGRACALHLAEHGYRVLAGLRDLGEGPSLGRDSGSGGAEIEPVELDVTDEDSIAAAVDRAKELTDDEGLVGVVNNAGEPVTGPLEVLPTADFRRELEVNLVGPLAVTQAFLPMLRASEGRIVFVTSVGGKIVLPFAGAYHASKFGLEAVVEALRQELRGSGVEVIAVAPGVTDSKIWEKADAQSRKLLEGLPAPQRNLYEADMRRFREHIQAAAKGGNMAPKRVAETVERALSSRRPATRYPVGRAAQAVTALRPFIPDRVFDALARRPFSG
jgi:NAD(P)-dependent dehydrogenase (short-subunit alcohol dehydrogenase family)